MIRRPPRSTLSSSSAASDVYKRQHVFIATAFCIFLSTKPCFFKSCFTTCGVIFTPLELKASEIFSRLRFVHFISAFMGLPVYGDLKFQRKRHRFFPLFR